MSSLFEITSDGLAQCQVWIEQADRTRRAGYLWPTLQAQASGQLLIVPGLGEHGGRYRLCAEFFRRAGFDVLAIDLIGHGRSPGPRGCIASYLALLDELETALAWLTGRNAQLPLLLWGHSMGGNLVINYLLRKSCLPQRAIASGPMLRATKPPSAAFLWLARQLERWLPNYTLKAPVRVEQCNSDVRLQAASKSDKLFHKRLSLRLGAGLIDSGEWAIAHANHLRTPLLVAHSQRDTITSPDASVLFAQRAGQLCTLKLYAEPQHDLHRDIGCDQVLSDFAAWFRRFPR